MNPLFLAVLLQLAAAALIIAEVVIPSGGLIALLAVAMLAYSLYLVFADVSTAAGMIVLGLDVVLFPAAVLVGLRLLAASPAALGRKLSRTDGVVAQSAELERFLGRSGIAATALRPGGVALIEGRRLDVVSRGEYIEKGTAVQVIAVTGNQIIVRAVTGPDQPK